VNVVAAEDADFAGFAVLAEPVEKWFGPMVSEPGFHRAVRNSIAAGRALCVRDASSTGLAGGLLFSGAHPVYHLDWLVVSESVRGSGVGGALVRAALARFTTSPATVEVVTFGTGHPGAVTSGSRAFYRRLGFIAGEAAPVGPEGGPRQLFRLALSDGGEADAGRSAADRDGEGLH
jgi:GNAT superfamily N-acetyltransferase